MSFIEKLRKSIRHVHLHDNFGGDSPKDDLHLPPGSGNVDFDSILKALVTEGYDGTMTLEVKPEFQETTKGNIQKMLSHIRRLPDKLQSQSLPEPAKRPSVRKIIPKPVGDDYPEQLSLGY